MLISKNVSDIAEVVQQGGVIAYPTEAVFGLGCDPLNEQAVNHLLQIKQRAVGKGVILIAADIEQLSGFFTPLTQHTIDELQRDRQKPTTWLVPASSHAPKWITGDHESIAVRISKHPASLSLCQACRHSLVSTSANPSQLTPAKTKQEVIAYFSDIIDAIFDAPLGGQETPSEIRDSQTGNIIRKG